MVRPADMLQASHRNNFIEHTALFGEIPIVGMFDTRPVLKTGIPYPPVRFFGLFLREGHPDAADPVMLCGIDHHAPPAAADIEECLARFQPQLPANMLALLFLSEVDGILGSLEVAAAVLHVLFQP